MTVNARLRLRAEKTDDIPVISSCLQDAIARIEDMTYIPRLHRFALVLTRFRWELANKMGKEGGERIRCGVHFDDVFRVRTQGIEMSDGEGLLPLLAITSEEDQHGVCLKLHFAGGGAVSLEAEVVNCHLSDLDQGWPTPSLPDHGLQG